jgi:nicotinate-nucleotide--dimethylbenzimidazole phosphoribosyltransferase
VSGSALSVSAVVDHVVASIGPASAAHAELAQQKLGGLGMGPVEQLAVRMAGAQHAVHLRAGRRALVVVAADHGVGAPGIDLGHDHPTAAALRAMAAGEGAIAGLARAAGATLVLVDAGCAGSGVPPAVVQVDLAPTMDYMEGAAMRAEDVVRGLEAGIALAVALADDGVDVIGVGRVGLGGDDAAAALVDALAPGAVVAPGAAAEALARLAEIGGGDTAVLAGVILAAASMTIPIVLDGHETLAAALVARALAPDVVGALVASQAGTTTAAKLALRALDLAPIVTAGIGHGDGGGAAMAMSLVPAAAALLG